MERFFKPLKKFFSYVFLIVFLFSIIGIIKVKASDYNPSSSRTERVIPIAMATDNRYVYPTLVAMTSICENKNKDTILKFHIMLSGEVSNENKQKMEKFQEIYRNVFVNIIDMKNRFSSAYLSDGYITSATYYRCAIPSLLQQYDKVLYIDGDTVITEDLWNLYNTNISEYYIAGVKDMGMFFDSSYLNTGYNKKLGIKNMEQYVNAGVLLINVKKMRNDGIERKFYDYIPSLKTRNLILQDQDVFNAVLYKKIMLISPKYNWMICHAKNATIEQLLKLYSDVCNYASLVQAKRYPSIIHYCGYEKPWATSNIQFYDQWNKYRKIVDQKILNDGHPVSWGTYTIVSALNEDYAVDLDNFGKDDGTNIKLHRRNGTDAQKFRIINIKGDEYEIEPVCSGKRIDVRHSGKDAGTNIWQFSPNGTDAQRFYIKKSGNYYTIQSKCNGLYMDVCCGEVKNDTNIWCWPGNNTNAQKFKFVVG